MFFEKPPVGFRLKLIFESCLREEDAYVFVDVARTPNVGTLLCDINDRFGLNKPYLRITVQGIKILPSENVLVLADTDDAEVSVINSELYTTGTIVESVVKKPKVQSSGKVESSTFLKKTVQGEKDPHEGGDYSITCTIAPNSTRYGTQKELTSVPIKHSKHKYVSSDSVNFFEPLQEEIYKYQSEYNADTHCQNVDPKKLKKFKAGDQVKVEECNAAVANGTSCDTNQKKLTLPIKHSKQNYNSKGLASFLEHLRMETYKSQSEDNVDSHCQNVERNKWEKSKPFNQQKHKEYDHLGGQTSIDHKKEEKVFLENGKYIDSNENTYNDEKTKRKRKRKHSKKKLETNYENVDETEGPEKNKSFSPSSSTRKHIFFDNNEEIEKTEKKEDGNTDLIVEFNASFAPFQKTAKNDEIHQQMALSSGTVNSTFIKTPMEPDIHRRKILHSNSPVKNEELISVMPKSGNSFASRIQSTVTFPDLKLRPKSGPNDSGAEKELSTLLMLKELKTSGQYFVQFQNESMLMTSNEKVNNSFPNVCATNQVIKSPRNSFLIPEKYLQEKDYLSSLKMPSNASSDLPCREQPREMCNSTGNEHVRLLSSVSSVGNESDECKMLLQFNVEDDKIKLRQGHNDWKILTPEIAEKELPHVVLPKEDQVIAFQILYLKHGVWPNLSDVMCGRVLRFLPDVRKVALQVPNAFINKIIDKSNSEEGSLPEGMVLIAECAYELDWINVKNPRLLA